MAARSTTQGTPVKSWSTTRAGLKGISTCGGRGSLPAGESFHVFFGDFVAVAIAEQRFEQHADGIGQGGDVAESGVLQFGEAIDAGFAVAGVEGIAGLEGIENGRRSHVGILGEKRAAAGEGRSQR